MPSKIFKNGVRIGEEGAVNSSKPGTYVRKPDWTCIRGDVPHPCRVQNGASESAGPPTTCR